MKNKIIYVNKKQILLHRYIIECKIGRKLLKSEQVHHVNGDHNDNRIENLKIVSHREHLALHHNKKFIRYFEIEKNDLKKLYLNDHLTIEVIAKKFNTTSTTVHRRLKEFGIERPIIICSCGNEARYTRSKKCTKCYHEEYREKNKERLKKYFRDYNKNRRKK